MPALRQTPVNKSTEGYGTTQIASPIGPLYTRHEFAAMLRLTVRSVDTMLANGTLPHLKIGGAIRFRVQDIQEALKGFEKK
jgi:excisionase family DNA binding protein